MKHYHKINSIFKRDPETKNKTFLDEYSCPEFGYLKDNLWIFTEKVNGTNIVIDLTDGKVTFGGRTEMASIPSNLVNSLNELILDKADLVRSVFPDCESVQLYGEGYGAKVNKGGGNYRSDRGFVLFDVRVGEWWLKRADCEDVAKKLGLDIVPIVGTGTLADAVEWCKDGFDSTWGDFQAEGLVLRPLVELKARNGERIITKVKCKDFSKEALCIQ